MCGENTGIRLPFSSIPGSSPRVRGKQQWLSSAGRHPGLIPACAGKTRRLCSIPRKFRAHPRVCGENHSNSNDVVFSFGSSPRVRGKPFDDRVEFAVCRLIPACAGKTKKPKPGAACSRAHPRVCGENTGVLLKTFYFQGSSPRVRGKHGCPPEDVLFPGLIPACAGKTLSAVVTVGQRWAHPRVCGENTKRSGVLTLRSVRSWKTLSFPSSLKVTHCRTFVQLSLSRIRL